MMDIVELYVIIDDFCKKFTPKYIKLMKKKGLIRRNRNGMLDISEIVLILILFPHSEFKCFKWFYIYKIMHGEYRAYFKSVPSYNRFVEQMSTGLIILSRLLGYLMYYYRKQNMGISYIDSTRIPVCHNKRTTSHKVNMKARLIPINIFDLIMSKKRVLIESVFNILKNKLQLCHTRHRSIKNFCVNILSVLVGYQLVGF